MWCPYISSGRLSKLVMKKEKACEALRSGYLRSPTLR